VGRGYKANHSSGGARAFWAVALHRLSILEIIYADAAGIVTRIACPAPGAMREILRQARKSSLNLGAGRRAARVPHGAHDDHVDEVPAFVGH
jgi:hypothetical protein